MFARSAIPVKVSATTDIFSAAPRAFARPRASSATRPEAARKSADKPDAVFACALKTCSTAETSSCNRTAAREAAEISAAPAEHFSRARDAEDASRSNADCLSPASESFSSAASENFFSADSARSNTSAYFSTMSATSSDEAKKPSPPRRRRSHNFKASAAVPESAARSTVAVSRRNLPTGSSISADANTHRTATTKIDRRKIFKSDTPRARRSSTDADRFSAHAVHKPRAASSKLSTPACTRAASVPPAPKFLERSEPSSASRESSFAAAAAVGPERAAEETFRKSERAARVYSSSTAKDFCSSFSVFLSSKSAANTRDISYMPP